MRLNKLVLHNFQGLRDLDLDFQGESVVIYGDNATGKTTVANAISWLLTDKPYNEAKNFSPKTRGEKDFLHHLEHSAEGVFADAEGKLTTLKKSYREIWTKKRGGNQEIFSGNTVDYYLDGIPVKEKEYQKEINALFGEPQTLRILIDPRYFSEGMSWEQRRKLLIECFGDIDDGDVINGNPELSELTCYLNPANRKAVGVDDFRILAAAELKSINKRLTELPGRIDEANRAIPEGKTISGDIDTQLKQINAALEAMTEQRAAAMAEFSQSDAAAEIKREISRLNLVLADGEAAHNFRENQAKTAGAKRINQAEAELDEAKKELAKTKGDEEIITYSIKQLKSLREDLLAAYEAEQNKRWEEGQEVCPVCLRPFPAEDIKAKQEEFNLAKSRRLAEINQRGKTTCSKEAIAAKEKELAGNKARQAVCMTNIKKLDKKLKEEKAALPHSTEYRQTVEAQKIARQIAALMQQLQVDKPIEKPQAIEGLDAEIARLKDQAVKLQEMKAKEATIAAQKKRIAELENEEANLITQYGYWQKGNYLCEQFIKTKVNLFNSTIDSHFPSVHYQMFTEQINGGVKECCEVLIAGENGQMVPYAEANNAARINAGIEIIGVLSRHYGLSLPVIVDNAESITALADSGGQIIRMVVSEKDKKLRLIIEQNKKGER